MTRETELEIRKTTVLFKTKTIPVMLVLLLSRQTVQIFSARKDISQTEWENLGDFPEVTCGSVY